MPLSVNATLIATPERALILFPPVKCAQCNGAAMVERYGTRPCSECQGSGMKDGQVCPECQERPGDSKGSGTRRYPEKIPCPGCNAKGVRARVADRRPSTLAALKVGDWIVIAVEFPAVDVKDTPQGQHFQNASAELISCVAVNIQRGTTGFTARVMQTPLYANGHGLRYGDMLQLNWNHCLLHTSCSAEDFEKSKNAGLLQANILPAIQPVTGQEFICRMGSIARIGPKQVDQTGEYFIGELDGQHAADAQWHMDGAGRGGRRDLDLVSPKAVVNV